jgi:hypothetical protein
MMRVFNRIAISLRWYQFGSGSHAPLSGGYGNRAFVPRSAGGLAAGGVVRARESTGDKIAGATAGLVRRPPPAFAR